MATDVQFSVAILHDIHGVASPETNPNLNLLMFDIYLTASP